MNDQMGVRFPLHYAADFGQLKLLEFFVRIGAEVDRKDKYGITPLLAAIWEGIHAASSSCSGWEPAARSARPRGRATRRPPSRRTLDGSWRGTEVLGDVLVTPDRASYMGDPPIVHFANF